MKLTPVNLRNPLALLISANLMACFEPASPAYSIVPLTDFSPSLLYSPEERRSFREAKNSIALAKGSGIRDILFNISSILNLSGSSSCHMVIDNFQNVDMALPTYTVAIVRRPQIAIFDCTVCSNDSRYSFLWTAVGYLDDGNGTKVEAGADGFKITCSRSKYMMGPLDTTWYQSREDLCLRLDLSEYAMQTRPWNCQVQISLQPVPNTMRVMRYPWDFYLNPRANWSMFNSPLRPEPSSVPKLHFLIYNNQTAPDMIDINDFMDQVIKLHMFREITADQLFGSALQTESYLITLDKETGSEVVTVSRILAVWGTKFPYVHIWLVPVDPNDPEKFRNLYDSESEQLWKVDVGGDAFSGTPILDDVVHFLQKMKLCKIGFSEVRHRIEDMQNRYNEIFGSGIASMLFAIIANATVTIDKYDYTNCYNGKATVDDANEPFRRPDIKLLAYVFADNISKAVSLSYKENFNGLVFVSCGTGREAHTFGFIELLRVYDKYIWACVFIASAFLTAMHQQFSSKYHRFHVLNFLKIYLGQGNPFRSSSLNRIHIRLSIFSALLAGIVISNGYKNSNVYNMIAPRLLLPYTQLAELVQDGFTIIMRPSQIFVDDRFWHFELVDGYYNWTATIFQKSKHEMQSDNFAVSSEVLEWSRYIKTLRYMPLLKNHSSLHPNTTETFINTFRENAKDWFNITFGGLEDPVGLWGRVDSVYKKLQSPHAAVVWKHLESCNKSALVLPGHLAKEYAARLYKSHPDYFVNLGRETYVNISIGFRIIGPIHPKLIKRTRAIMFSGIWNWWSDFIVDRTSFSPSLRDTSLKRPNMQGNVSIIFLVLLYGNVLSVVCFLAEDVHRLSSYIRYMCRRIVTFIVQILDFSRRRSIDIGMI